MVDEVLENLIRLDRGDLMARMASELPNLRETLGISLKELAEKTGVLEAKLKNAENGKRQFKWSEYMSILFVIWNNDKGRDFLEKRDLFPKELKDAMSANRMTHAPTEIA